MLFELKPQKVEAVLFDGKEFSEKPSWLEHLEIYISNGEAVAYHPWFDEEIFRVYSGWYVYRLESGVICREKAADFLERYQQVQEHN